MSYYGQDGQKEIIDKFNEGKCRLIVSTSVLEEGIDVATCDTVIRYGGSATLIQIIQSKGRARSKEGKFFVLLTEDERKYIDRVVHQDIIAKQVLQKAATVDADISDDFIKELENQKTFAEDTFPSFEDAHSYTLSFEFEIFVTFKDTQTDSIENQGIVKTAFSNLRCLLERIDISLNQAQYKNLSLLSEDAVVLVLARTSLQNFFEELFRIWNFIVNDKIALMSIPNLYTGDSECVVSKEVPVISVSVGHFDGKQYFARTTDLMGFSDSILHINSGRSLIFKSFDKRKEMELSVKDLDSYISFSFNVDHHMTLYIPLLHTPKVYHTAEADDRRCRVFLAHPPHYNPEDDSIEADLYRISKCAVIAVKIKFEHFERILGIFGDPIHCGVPTYVTRITETEIADIIAFPQVMSAFSTGRDIAWEYARLQSDGVNPWVLNKICCHISDYIAACDESDVILKAVLLSLRSLDMYKNLKRHKEFFDKYLHLLDANSSLMPQVELSDSFGAIAPGYMLVDRVVFTLSRLYILPPVPVKSNRVLRKYHHQYRFVYVSFRDERFQRIFGSDIYRNRFLAVLKNGFDVVDEHYSFLCCSNSQMREGIAVFFNGSNEQAENLRRQLLPDPSVSETKYASRIGLFCTADYNTVSISEELYRVDEDIMSKCQKLLTDGAGLVSQEICDQVLLRMEMSGGNTFQIRYKGFKGILTVDPHLNFPGVLFRESMRKFISPQGPEDLGIVKVFGFTPVTLNRDMLTLVSCLSTEGVTGGDWLPAPYIMELLDEELSVASKILLNRISALEALEQYFPHFEKNIVKDMKIDIICEPMWLRMLQLIYNSKIQRLRRKTHIPVKKGAFLVGVPDPRKVLHDNQVFVSIEREGESFILEGRVLVYRNPCLNPGDLRVVEAVDKPDLHYLKNVLVMPASNEISSSLAANCSGGDNDGDEYSVIWDPNLVPPPNREQPPFDYDEFQRVAKEKMSLRTTSAPSYIETVINNMSNQNLGKIAHMFVAIADYFEDGARNQIAKLLAEAQCLAVDYPKTGIPPEIPSQAREIIRANGYPDFMEKRGLSYISKKPLGELYRRCISITTDIELERLAVVHGSLDPRFLLQGREKYVSSSKNDYRAYVEAIRVLMIRYELKNEYEVLLGIPTSWYDDELTSNCGASLSSLKDQLKSLIRHFRDLFFHDPRIEHGENERLYKCSAWYEEAYTDGGFLSFPWIVSDVLADVLKNSADLQLDGEIGATALYANIGSSFRDLWIENMQSLKTVLTKKEQLFIRIRYSIREYDPSLEIEKYGSVELLLCDAMSDLDLCSPPTEDLKALITEGLDSREIELNHLERVLPAVDQVAAWKDLRKAANIPIIRAEVDGDHVDVCAKEDGLYKARLLRILYSMSDCFLLLLSNMMQLGQVCGLLRCLSSEQGIFPIKNGEFHAIFVNFFLIHYNIEEHVMLKRLSNYVREEDDFLISKSINCDPAELGHFLLNFLEYGIGLSAKGKFIFKWPVPGEPVHELSSDAMRKFSDMCLRAKHTLGLTRSWAMTLQRAADAENQSTSFSLSLSRSHSEILSPYRKFHQLKLSHLSGCKVIIVATDINDLDGSNISQALEVRASGRPYEIYKLRLELSKLLNSRKSLYAGVVRTDASKYFMEGSTYVFAQGAESMESMLEIDDYLGPVAQRAHRQLGLSKVKLRSDPFVDWQSIFIIGIKDKIISQLQSLEPSRAQTLRLSVHYGNFYLIRANLIFDRIGSVSVKDIERCLADNKRMRKTDDRPDFDPTGRVNFLSENAEESVDESVAKNNPSKNGSVTTTNLNTRKVNRKLACGFYSSLCEPEFLSKNEKKIVNFEEFINQVLVDEGFVPSEKPISFKVGNYCNGAWLLDMKASASYEASIALDNELNILGVAERPLSWVHGTLLGESLKGERVYDLRFKLTTSKVLAVGDHLYDFACPGGRAPISVKDGCPIPREDLPEGTRNRVVFARHVDKRVPFEFNDEQQPPLHIFAVFIRGAHFEGLRLEEKSEVADFSLEVDLSPLVEGMENCAIDTSEWLSRMLRKVVHLSNRIPSLENQC